MTGHIYYRGQFAGGLVAYSDGTTSINNCHVATVIHDNAIWTTGFDGGLVAWQYGSLSIMGCTFTGRLLSAKNSCLCGGFVCWSNGNAISITNSLYAPDTNIPLAADENDYVDGYTFVQADNPAIDNSYYTQTIRASLQGTKAYALTSAPANLGSLVQDYGMMTAYENGILYDGKYYVAPEAITLADTGTNDVEGIDGYFADVTLTGRTLYRDGDWNTLCLPFNVANLSGTPLDGATLMTLSTAGTAFDAASGTLTLNFEGTTAIEAGKPYIVKWTKADGYDEASADTRDVKNPVFSGVTISSTAADVETDAVTFKGNYDYQPFTAENRSILFLGNGNTLYYPLSGASIGACRAYFQLNGINAGDPASPAPVRAFVLRFGDEENTTGILSLTPAPSPKGEGSIYTLDGRKLQGKLSQRGIYINNGKKIVIK